MRQILIVEDDITLNQGLYKALRNDKWHIVSCGTAKEARDQFAVGDVSLVLLDINLPDGNGIDLLKEFKNQNPAIPVIMLTAIVIFLHLNCPRYKIIWLFGSFNHFTTCVLYVQCRF